MNQVAPRLASRFALELAVAALTGAIGLALALGSLEYGIGWAEDGPESGTFPFYVALLVVLASAGTIAQTITTGTGRDDSAIDVGQARHVAKILLPTIVAAALMPYLGLYVPSALYLAYVMRVEGKYGWPFSLGLGLATMLVFFIMFEFLFTVPLLKGPLEALLGFY